jgi:hypothetical protein
MLDVRMGDINIELQKMQSRKYEPESTIRDAKDIVDGLQGRIDEREEAKRQREAYMREDNEGSAEPNLVDISNVSFEELQHALPQNAFKTFCTQMMREILGEEECEMIKNLRCKNGTHRDKTPDPMVTPKAPPWQIKATKVTPIHLDASNDRGNREGDLNVMEQQLEMMHRDLRQQAEQQMATAEAHRISQDLPYTERNHFRSEQVQKEQDLNSILHAAEEQAEAQQTNTLMTFASHAKTSLMNISESCVNIKHKKTRCTRLRKHNTTNKESSWKAETDRQQYKCSKHSARGKSYWTRRKVQKQMTQLSPLRWSQIGTNTPRVNGKRARPRHQLKDHGETTQGLHPWERGQVRAQ